MAVVIFCNDYLAPRSVDPDFSAEYDAARAAGFDTLLVCYEDLIKGLGVSLPLKAPPPQGLGIYRGWMLAPGQYGQLYGVLEGLGIQLVNTPKDYAHTHHFPNCYPILSGNTPTSISLKIDGSPDFDRIIELLSVFGSKPVVLKDYVKSEKHYWREACYIPDASDRRQVEQVTRRFLELRGDQLNEGLVYREFVPLAHLAEHSKSGMPTAVEYRLFFADARLLAASPYWEEGEYRDELPDITDFERIAKQVRSRFFSMDIAKRDDGGWTIMELGDGQVSGLPVALEPKHFYERLFALVKTVV